MTRLAVEERKAWRWWVTPKPLAGKPIHRWYVFPHSFASELIHALIDEWGLTPHDHILDPFAGAGTTLLAAKEKGIPATGYDLSPLAVLAASVKIANYKRERLEDLWSQLLREIRPTRWNGPAKDYPDLVRKALPGELLGAFDALDRSIAGLKATRVERDLFRLALLATIPEYSRAVAKGGWLRWVDRQRNASTILADLSKRIEMMLEDLKRTPALRGESWHAHVGDARSLPDRSATYTAVITSPPYPNRHDYTRIFGVELMFGFLDWEQTRQLRYQTFHSHPEARPVRPDTKGYVQPGSLARAVAQIGRQEKDPRVKQMIEGYFLDLYLALREVGRVCKRKARVAFVVGNAQYRGVPIAVDELTAEIGEQAGLRCEKLFVARYRGNSAQQMGKFGRNPARESVVVFRKP
jgi:site-specific DNA-methyltransferase (cytosine-N4-specific)